MMKRNQRSKRSIKKEMSGLLILLLSLSLFGCENVFSSSESDSILTVGDVSCSKEFCSLVLYSCQQIYEENYAFGEDPFSWDSPLTEESNCWEYVRDFVALEELCTVATLSCMAEERGISLSKEEEAVIAEASSAFQNEIGEEILTGGSETEEDIKTFFRRYLLSLKCIEELTEDVTEEISDEETRVAELIRITVLYEEEAGEICRRIEEGEDVQTVISTEEAVDSEKIAVSRKDLQDEFAEAAFSLKTGQVSLPVETEDGWTFFYCENEYNATISEQNKEQMNEDRKKEVWISAMQDFQEETDIYFDEIRYEEFLPAEIPSDTGNLFSVFSELFPRQSL